MARRLSEGLASVSGVELIHPTDGNEVFVRLPPQVQKRLEDRGYLGKDHSSPTHRLVASFSTTQEEVDKYLDAAQGVASNGLVIP